MVWSKFKLLYPILSICYLSLLSCSTDRNNNVIEKKEFVTILTELNITDALLANEGWYDAKLKDSARSYYNYILKKHNTSRAKFDYSLDYYSRDVEDFAKIYEQVSTNIANKIPIQLYKKSIYNIFEESYKEAEIKHDLSKHYGPKGIELWKNKNSCAFPKDSADVNVEVKQNIKYQCLLVLNSDILVYPNDSSQNLRMEIEINYKDTTNAISEKEIITKDGKWRTYQLFLITDSTKAPKSVNAKVISWENKKHIPHLQLRNISLKQYAPGKDTSLLIPDF